MDLRTAFRRSGTAGLAATTAGAGAALVAAALVARVLTGPASAHIDYVTDDTAGSQGVVEFVVGVLSSPANALLFGGTAVAGLVAVGGYLWMRPAVRDLAVLRETLSGYADLVPWMLRLSMGLPLVGAGFAGYYFSPAVETGPRLLMIGLGFFLLFGLATRAVATLALLAYLAGLAVHAELLLAMEFVAGLLAIVLLGGGRPSADHMLQAVASADATLYGRVDPVHRVADWFRAAIDAWTPYAATVVRVGLGVTFVYLGFVQKLVESDQALATVARYDLTAIVPVDPGAWVLGAGLAEIALGLLLIVGLLTRSVAAAAFVVFTLTMFGLPDDPVLAHVTMFGLASAVFTMGAGPLALDNLLGSKASAAPRAAPSD
jgi:uncharacterized membrane protein YphA (DoxX/SURF4 family)